MELLAPAGSWAAMVAAVGAGADAVYMGAPAFNARQGAENFIDLSGAVDYCHLRGVKVYVTLNTLVLPGEWDALQKTAQDIAAAHPDGVLVQDMGVAEYLSQAYPEMPLHASTQMVIHNAEGIEAVKQLGCTRAVLSRETSLADIASMCNRGIEIEVFVHGALCVAWSGQCLLSSMIGGRSGNRGRCAQPCRMPWRIEGPGVEGQGYLLSPRDLCMLPLLPELQRAGVDSLKIEGRLKRPEYVATVVDVYRRALDDLAEGRFAPPDEDTLDRLKLAFHRGGFSTGYLEGLQEKRLMDPSYAAQAGVPLGRVERMRSFDRGEVRLSRALEQQDVIEIRGKASCAVTYLSDGKQAVKALSAGGGVINLPKGAQAGDTLYLLVSQRVERQARALYEKPKPRVALRGGVVAQRNHLLSLTLHDDKHVVSLRGEMVAPAQNRALSADSLRAQVSKLGGTVFYVDQLDALVDENVYVSAAGINALRREAVSELTARRIARSPYARQPVPAAQPLPRGDGRPQVTVRVSDADGARAALEAGADAVYFSPWSYRDEAAFTALPESDRLYFAPPAQLLPADLSLVSRVAGRHRSRFCGLLLGNVGQLDLADLWQGRFVGDLPLNVANAHSALYYFTLGARRLTLSCELTLAQSQRVMAEAGGAHELVVHGRLCLMTLAHCPVRAQRGGCEGCAAPARQVALIDRRGEHLPLRPVRMSRCQGQLYNAHVLDMADRFDALTRAGADAWRLEMALETPARVAEVTAAYVQGARSGAIGAFTPPQPTTHGHYFRGLVQENLEAKA